jgi:predicted XRE-type DNA-binding protein
MSSPGHLSARSSSSEEWRAIPGYKGFYEVSNLGRVRSLDRFVPAKKGGQQKCEGRMLCLCVDSGGYLVVNLWKYGKQKTKTIHKLVKNTFHGPTPEGLNVLHGNKGQKCNELSNLEFGTREKNHGPDRVRDGTDNRGEKSVRAKLNNAQARIIKKLLKSDCMKNREIAKIFGVTDCTIADIKRGKSWVHLESEPANMLDLAQ